MTSRPPGTSGATVAITILNFSVQLLASAASPSRMKEAPIAPGLRGFIKGPSRCGPNTTASPGSRPAAIEVIAESDSSMNATGQIAVGGALAVVPQEK